MNLPASSGTQGGHLLPAQPGQLLFREGTLEKMGPEGTVGGVPWNQVSVTYRDPWDGALPTGMDTCWLRASGEGLSPLPGPNLGCPPDQL